MFSVSLPPFSCPSCLEYLRPRALILLKTWRYIRRLLTYLLTYLLTHSALFWHVLQCACAAELAEFHPELHPSIHASRERSRSSVRRVQNRQRGLYNSRSCSNSDWRHPVSASSRLRCRTLINTALMHGSTRRLVAAKENNRMRTAITYLLTQIVAFCESYYQLTVI